MGPSDRCRLARALLLEATNQLGDVRDFLLEVALVLLESPQQLLCAREPPAAVVVSAHVFTSFLLWRSVSSC